MQLFHPGKALVHRSFQVTGLQRLNGHLHPCALHLPIGLPQRPRRQHLQTPGWCQPVRRHAYTITDAAVKLGVNRVTLSRVVSGAWGISADMADCLALAFVTSAEMWGGMQMQYDLCQAGKLKLPKIERMTA
jgi:hypothetical protein